MSEIPTISVTKDDDNSCDHGDNGDFDVSGLSGALTDIEDMDSNDEEEFEKQFNKSTSGSRRPTATDIEDYNDSCSDDETSTKYPVLMLSLQEFLNHGITEERTSNNRLNETREVIAGNYLGIDMNNKTDDCPTENDNFSISSDDEPYEKSVCLDFSLMHLENNNSEDHKEHIEGSDEEDLSKSDCIDYMNEASGGCLSEDEVIDMSKNEEEFLVAISSSEEDYIQEHYPIIDVKFTPKDKVRKGEGKNFLQVSLNCEESLTDIEKIELSAAEDSEDDCSIPIARALVVDSTENSNTDIEDMYLSENTKFSEEMDSYNIHQLPPPHREMIFIKEDKNGDPITNVVAMENDFNFGLADYNHDDLLTDIEDVSSAVEDMRDFSTKECVDLGLDNDVVHSSDNVKTLAFKRNEHLDSLTDTEEIFVSGSVRRKKNKLKTQKSKTKQTNVFELKKYDPEYHESLEPITSSSSRSMDNKYISNENVSTRKQPHCSNISSTAEIYSNESFTVVHEKCVNMFDVQKEKKNIKGLKECLETHTDVEYVEVEQVDKNQ